VTLPENDLVTVTVPLIVGELAHEFAMVMLLMPVLLPWS
jgi:hypothetical protein